MEWRSVVVTCSDKIMEAPEHPIDSDGYPISFQFSPSMPGDVEDMAPFTLSLLGSLEFHRLCGSDNGGVAVALNMAISQWGT